MMYDIVDQFAYNFAKYASILKILLPADWMINV